MVGIIVYRHNIQKQTVMESHQTSASLTCLATVAQPLFSSSIYPQGAQHIIPLMQLTLPGVDPNDAVKTQATLQFYSALLSTIPLSDCSSADPDKYSEQEMDVFTSTAYIEEWVLALVDKCLLLFESQVEGSVSKFDMEGGISRFIVYIALSLFNQMSDAIYALALDKILKYVSTHLVIQSAKSIGLMCNSAVRSRPEIALKQFFAYFTPRIIALTQSQSLIDDDSADEQHTDHELEWAMHIISRVVRRTGTSLLEHSTEIISILSAIFTLSSTKVQELGSKFLRHVLRSLTENYTSNTKFLPQSVYNKYASTPERLFEQRGAFFGPWDDIEMEWHVPSQKEADFAEHLLTLFFSPAVEWLKKLSSPVNDREYGIVRYCTAPFDLIIWFLSAYTPVNIRSAKSAHVGNLQSKSTKNLIKSKLGIVNAVLRGANQIIPEINAPRTDAEIDDNGDGESKVSTFELQSFAIINLMMLI